MRCTRTRKLTSPLSNRPEPVVGQAPRLGVCREGKLQAAKADISNGCQLEDAETEALCALSAHPPQAGHMPGICRNSLRGRSASFARLPADHVAAFATGGEQVEEVDGFLQRDVIEVYKELCENRLLPVSILPR